MSRQLSSVLMTAWIVAVMVPAVGDPAPVEKNSNGLAQGIGMAIDPGGLTQRIGTVIDPGGLAKVEAKTPEGLDIEPNGRPLR